MCLRCLQALNTEVAEVTKGWDCCGGNFFIKQLYSTTNCTYISCLILNIFHLE